MTTYYLLIIAADVIDETASFYKIKVGSGAQDVARLHALKALAASRNWYFRPYTHNTADFLLKIALSLGKMPDQLGMIHLSAKNFMIAWKSYQKKLSDATKKIHKLTVGNRKSHQQRQLLPKKVIQHAECVTRSKPKCLVIDFKAYINQIY